MLITVDTGGTKTLVAGFDAAGSIISSTKFPTPKDQKEYLEAVSKTVNEIAEPGTIDALVLALPGLIKHGTAIWCNNLDWYDFPIKEHLEEMFPNVPILVENDANLAGLGATRKMEPMPQTSLYVTFSTGVGTGVTTNGKLNPGFLYSEGGHAIVKHEGEFKSWENIASGRRLYQAYGKYARDITDDEIWQDMADRMSRGLLVLVPFMQPDAVIIGGSMGSYFDRFGHHLERILDEKLISYIHRPQIVAATHPEEIVAYGSYYHALDEFPSLKITA